MAKEPRADSHGSMAMRHLNYDLHKFHHTYKAAHEEVHDTPAGKLIEKLLATLESAIAATRSEFEKNYPEHEPLAEHTPEETMGGGEPEEEVEQGSDEEGKAFDEGEPGHGLGEDYEEGETGEDQTAVPRTTVPEEPEGSHEEGHGEGELDEEGYREGAESTRYHKGGESAYDVAHEDEEDRRLSELHSFLEELAGTDGHPNTLRTASKYHAQTMKDLLMAAQGSEPHEGRIAPPPTDSIQTSPSARGYQKAARARGAGVGYRSISRPRIRHKDATAEDDSARPQGVQIATPAGEDDAPHVGKSWTAEQQAEIDKRMRALNRRAEMLDKALASAGANGTH